MQIGRIHDAPIEAIVTVPYTVAADPAVRHMLAVAQAASLDFGSARPRAVQFTFMTGSAANVQVHDSDSPDTTDRLCGYPAKGVAFEFRTKGRFLVVSDTMEDAASLVLAWEL